MLRGFLQEDLSRYRLYERLHLRLLLSKHRYCELPGVYGRLASVAIASLHVAEPQQCPGNMHCGVHKWDVSVMCE